MTIGIGFATAVFVTLGSVLVTQPAIAVDDLSLNVAAGSENVQPGDTVTVTLDIANLSVPINGVQVRLNYDTTVMTLIDVLPTDLVAAGLIIDPLPDPPFAAGWVELF